MSNCNHLLPRVSILRSATVGIAISLLCLLPLAVFAQHSTKADRKFDEGSYADAMALYKEALNDSGDSAAYLHYRIGECYLRMNHPEDALSWFTSAQTQGYSQPDILYSLGATHMLLASYDAALSSFKAYALKQPDDKRTAVKIASCNFAKSHGSSNPAFTIYPVESLNSTGSEYGIAYDQTNQLIYASTGPIKKLSHRKTSSRTGLGYSTLYKSQVDTNGAFQPGVELLDASGERVNRGVLSYDRSSDRYYCTTCHEGRKECYISILKIKGTHIQEVGRLKIGDVDYGIGHPFVTNDGQTLYFTSTMEGGYGGDDIWYSEKQADGKWAKPINAGAEVNTAGNEVFPYVHRQQLFFASDGHEGYGGLDLYVSKITNNGYAKAFNLRQPFNSEKDDFNLIISDDEVGGLMVSNWNNQQGSDNIYQFDAQLCVVGIEGFVYDSETKKPIANALISLQGAAGQEVRTLTTDSLARYDTFLDAGVDYRVVASAAGYSSEEKRFDSSAIPCFTLVSTTNGYDADFYLRKPTVAPTVARYTIVIKDIYYEFGLSRITSQASVELDRIVALLKKYPQMNIRIAAHTDARGSDAYNQKLSEERANSTALYLQQQGVDPSRIEKKAYGESQPAIATAQNEGQQQLNRRTVFSLLSYTDLPDEEIRMLSTEELLMQESPNEISGHTSWWIQVAVVKHADIVLIEKVERKVGVKVEAIKFDDGFTHLCIGPFESPEKASQMEAQLNERGVETVLKYIQPKGK